MNIDLKPCLNCGKEPVKEIHGVSYIIICNPCNIKTKTAVIYDDYKIEEMFKEWNKLNEKNNRLL